MTLYFIYKLSMVFRKCQNQLLLVFKVCPVLSILKKLVIVLDDLKITVCLQN